MAQTRPDNICGAWWMSKLLDTSPEHNYLLITEDGRFANITTSTLVDGATFEVLERLIDSGNGPSAYTRGWTAWVARPDYGRFTIETTDLATGKSEGFFSIYVANEHYRQRTINGDVDSAPGDLAVARVYPLFGQDFSEDTINVVSPPMLRLFHYTRLPQSQDIGRYSTGGRER